MKHLVALALLALLPQLAACQREASPAPSADTATRADGGPAPRTALGRTVASAMDKARRELHEGNLVLNDTTDIRVNGKRIQRSTGDLPRAEITPDGQVIVAGTPVAMDDAGRALARDYRASILAVAETGMDLGVQGADLGMRAAADAIGSLLRGDTAEMEKRVEAEAAALEASAMRLCDQLPALLATQQALAAAVPQIAPYARMEASDIEDCRRKSERIEADTGHADAGAAASAEGPTQADAAAEADAAASRAR